MENMTMANKTIGKKNRAGIASQAAQFDKEFVCDTFSAMTPEAKARWRQAKARRGRPQKGQGAKIISVSVEKGLLTRSDRLAKQLGITRAELIARGLAATLAAMGTDE